VLSGIFILWVIFGAGASPKDCVELSPGVAETVHQGRYNILCVRPAAGAVSVACEVADVATPSRLQVHPLAIDGAYPQTVSIAGDGPLPEISGSAGSAAYVFFSYDGPFDPIRDGYSLTCHW